MSDPRQRLLNAAGGYTAISSALDGVKHVTGVPVGAQDFTICIQDDATPRRVLFDTTGAGGWVELLTEPLT